MEHSVKPFSWWVLLILSIPMILIIATYFSISTISITVKIESDVFFLACSVLGLDNKSLRCLSRRRHPRHFRRHCSSRISHIRTSDQIELLFQFVLLCVFQFVIVVQWLRQWIRLLRNIGINRCILSADIAKTHCPLTRWFWRRQ